MSAKTTVTAKNIRSGNDVSIPEPGRIVAVTYDIRDNQAKASDAWSSKKVTGIVMSHGVSYDFVAKERVPNIVVLALDGNNYEIAHNRISKSTYTRSVPKEAREVLTSIYNWHSSEKAKWDEKVRKAEQQREKAKKACGADNPSAALAAACGTLSDSEFSTKLWKKLVKAVPEIKSDGWHLHHYRMDYKLTRTVYIEKWYDGPMSYLEYDNNRFLVPDAEETAEGKRYINDNRRTLPVAAELDEHLCLGDKDYLTYEAAYKLPPIGEGVLLTEELADKLVAMFAN